MNEIVKYDNYMNKLKFSGFTPTDYNFLMFLCSKLRDKETAEVTISFEELRKKTGYTQHPVKQFISDLVRMNEKLMKMSCVLKKDGIIFQFVLFPTFATDTINERLIVAVNERFKFILNDLTKNFTRFELSEFVELDSKYTKSLYRLLKQFKSTGKYETSLENFRNRMDCPESYTNKHVMDKIIKPSLKELKEKEYFHNLKCETKYAHRRGRPVMGYMFTFTPETSSSGSDQDKAPEEKKIRRKKSPDKYSGYHQRIYDYDALEKELLNQAAAVERTPDHEAEQLDSELRRQLEKCRKGLDP